MLWTMIAPTHVGCTKCHCYICITNHFFLLTDTAASASAISLKMPLLRWGPTRQRTKRTLSSDQKLTSLQTWLHPTHPLPYGSQSHTQSMRQKHCTSRP
jgi:hypothetical protein